MKKTGYHHYTWLAWMFLFFASCEECGINGITSEPLPQGAVGLSYNARLDIDTECRPILEEFFLVGGTLPPGLAMSRDGRIQGTPSRAGEYYFTVVGEVCYSEDIFGYFDCYEQSKGLVINID